MYPPPPPPWGGVSQPKVPKVMYLGNGIPSAVSCAFSGAGVNIGLAAGSPVGPASSLAPGSDLRTDLPRYRVFKDGEPTAEVTDATKHWPDDLVSFLIGCNFSFQRAVAEAGIPLRHFQEGKSDPTFVTSVETSPAGIFHGPMVVSMWPIHWSHVSRVVQITSRFTAAHGAPVHIGEPSAIGIKDILRPEYGDVVELKEGEVPVFWGCGVTPQEAILRGRPSVAITHSAGHMFVTDLRD